MTRQSSMACAFALALALVFFIRPSYYLVVAQKQFTVPLQYRVPVNSLRRRRRLERTEAGRDQIQTASLFRGEGTHYMELWIGNPPQRQTLIVDTGSGVTAFPCSGCIENDEKKQERNTEKSSRLDPFFNVSASSTFRYLTCDYCFRGSCHPKADSCHLSTKYREGSSWKAREATDMCFVGDYNNRTSTVRVKNGSVASIGGASPAQFGQFQFPLKFGCQTSLTGAFTTQMEDGILGMDRKSGTLWRQMYDAGVLNKPGFALCFGRASRDQQRAGVLTLGGSDERLHSTSTIYTRGFPARHSSSYFGVFLRRIYLQKSSHIIRLNISASKINSNPIVVDSGATDTYLSKSVKTSFQKIWKYFTGESFQSDADYKRIDHLPTLVFQLKGYYDYNRNLPRHHPLLAGSLDPEHFYDVLVSVPPSHLFEYDDEDEYYIPRFHFDPNFDSAFGSSSMIGHDVYFEERRIGWAQSTCDYSATLVTPYDLNETGLTNETIDNKNVQEVLKSSNILSTKEHSNSSGIIKDGSYGFFTEVKNETKVAVKMIVDYHTDDDSVVMEETFFEFRNLNLNLTLSEMLKLTRLHNSPSLPASLTPHTDVTHVALFCCLFASTMIVYWLVLRFERWRYGSTTEVKGKVVHKATDSDDDDEDSLPASTEHNNSLKNNTSFTDHEGSIHKSDKSGWSPQLAKTTGYVIRRSNTHFVVKS